jgi:hypothetical protein
MNTFEGIPPEQLKWRRSWQSAPGQQFITPGLVGVPMQVPEGYRHGVKSSNGQSDKAADCLHPNNDSEMLDFIKAQKEKVYASTKKEPLGAPYKRGQTQPAETLDTNFRYGVTSLKSESAASLIHFVDPNAHLPPKTMRGGSVGKPAGMDQDDLVTAGDISRQMNRMYDWNKIGVDPTEFRFGHPAKLTDLSSSKSVELCIQQDASSNGKTVIISDRAENVNKHWKNPLGTAKLHRGALANLGKDFVFGKKSCSSAHSVRQLLEEGYSTEDLKPDRKLGLSTGKMSSLQMIPHDPVRRFGVPSIRVDKPYPASRSCADDTNYGNEMNAFQLLYPTKFVAEGVTADDFYKQRQPEEIKEIFSKIGEVISESDFKRCCDLATSEFGALSVDSFRHSWNKVKLQRFCVECGANLCQHDFCSSLPCKHDEMANHALHAQHKKQDFAAVPSNCIVP